jgi:hypothetical protein
VGGAGDAAGERARGLAAEVQPLVVAGEAHPRAIAEQRAAGQRARRIDRDHRDAALARGDQRGGQRADQRRLADAGRAGQADTRPGRRSARSARIAARRGAACGRSSSNTVTSRAIARLSPWPRGGAQRWRRRSRPAPSTGVEHALHHRRQIVVGRA